MKEILIYVFLGIVQGLTEPLPISSSGHVFVLKKLLGITTSDLNFEIVVNFGSLLAILLIYKDDLIKLITASILSNAILKPSNICALASALFNSNFVLRVTTSF